MKCEHDVPVGQHGDISICNAVSHPQINGIFFDDRTTKDTDRRRGKLRHHERDSDEGADLSL